MHLLKMAVAAPTLTSTLALASCSAARKVGEVPGVRQFSAGGAISPRSGVVRFLSAGTVQRTATTAADERNTGGDVKSSPSGQKRSASGSTQVPGQVTRPVLVALIVGAWVLALAVPALAKTPAWKVVSSPSPGPAAGSDELNGISCVSAASCTAVGDSENRLGTGRLKTLIESWNGRRWSVVPSPNPDRFADSLRGVSCVSARSCTAAGFGTSRSRSSEKTLIESWNGKRWSVVPSPNPRKDDYLVGVSCVSATACTAAGDYDKSSGATKTLIESD